MFHKQNEVILYIEESAAKKEEAENERSMLIFQPKLSIFNTKQNSNRWKSRIFILWICMTDDFGCSMFGLVFCACQSNLLYSEIENCFVRLDLMLPLFFFHLSAQTPICM